MMPTCTGRLPPPGSGASPAVAVRLAGLGAGPHRAAVRLPLPHRDLRAPRSGCTATRAAVPARRPPVGRVDLKADGRRPPAVQASHIDLGPPHEVVSRWPTSWRSWPVGSASRRHRRPRGEWRPVEAAVAARRDPPPFWDIGRAIQSYVPRNEGLGESESSAATSDGCSSIGGGRRRRPRPARRRGRRRHRPGPVDDVGEVERTHITSVGPPVRQPVPGLSHRSVLPTGPARSARAVHVHEQLADGAGHPSGAASGPSSQRWASSSLNRSRSPASRHQSWPRQVLGGLADLRHRGRQGVPSPPGPRRDPVGEENAASKAIGRRSSSPQEARSIARVV